MREAARGPRAGVSLGLGRTTPRGSERRFRLWESLSAILQAETRAKASRTLRPWAAAAPATFSWSLGFKPQRAWAKDGPIFPRSTSSASEGESPLASPSLRATQLLLRPQRAAMAERVSPSFSRRSSTTRASSMGERVRGGALAVSRAALAWGREERVSTTTGTVSTPWASQAR